MGRVIRNFAGYTVIGFIGLIVAGIALKSVKKDAPAMRTPP